MPTMNLEAIARILSKDSKSVDAAAGKLAAGPEKFGTYLQKAAGAKPGEDRTGPDPAASRSADPNGRASSDRAVRRGNEAPPPPGTGDPSAPANDDSPSAARTAPDGSRPDPDPQAPRPTPAPADESQDSTQEADAALSAVTLLQVAGIPVALPVPAAETVVAPQDAVLPAMATGQAPILQDIAPGTVIATEIRQPGGIGETFGPKTGFQLQPGTTPPAAGPEATDTIPGAPPDVAAETAPPVRPTSDDAPVAPMTAVAVDPVAAAVAVPVAAPASAPAVTLPTEPKPGDSLPDTAAHQPGPAGLYSRPVAKAETELPPRPADSLAAAATPEVVSAPGAERAAPQQRADAVLEDLDSDGAGDSGRALPSQADSGAGAPVAAQQPATSHAVTPGGTARSAQPLETQLSLADRIRFVHRVEQAFQDLRGDGGTIRMRLSPPELGSLRLEIKVLNGELTARVETDTPSARNLLLDNLPALRDRLAQHDIKVQRFDIDLMDRSGGGPANQSPQYQNPSPQNGGAVPRAPARTAAEPAAAVATPPARPIGDGGRLNVIV